VKGAVRLRRPSAAYSTLLTIVMMCLSEQKEIVVEETVVEIFFTTNRCCTVVITLVMEYNTSIISICEELQKQIVSEIETMTPFTVEHVHLSVKRLVC
jgi:uncharacterized alkaline shock family protein YloU